MDKNKKVFSLVTILFWFSIYAYMPQLSNYAKELGASYKLIGLIGGAYGLTQTILRIPIGIISDKIGSSKIFVIIGVFCAVSSALLAYLFQNPYVLLLVRLIAGIASATWVNFTVLFIGYYNPDESNKAVGVITSNSKLGQLIAMFVGGFIAVKFGVKAIFLLSTIASSISLLISFFIYEKKPIKDQRKSTNSLGITSVFKDRRVVHISLLAALLQFITFATNMGFTPIIAANLGANDLQLGLLSTAFTFPQVAFAILANTLMTKKLGQKNSLQLGFLLITMVCFITPFTPSLFLLYPLQIIAGIGNIVIFSLLMAMVIKGVKGNVMTTTMALFQAIYGIGMVAGPIVLGSLGDFFGLTIAFMVVGTLGIFAMNSVSKLEFKYLNSKE